MHFSKPKALLIGCFLFLSISALTEASNSNPEILFENNAFSETLEQFYSNIFTPIGATIGVIISALFVLAYEEFISKRKLRQEIRDEYLTPEILNEGGKRNSIILVGDGGTGKTTLIRNLLQVSAADPRFQTEACDIYTGYRGAKTTSATKNTKNIEETYLFHITDYMGQNIRTLVRGFIQQQSTPNSPIKLGFINSLIIMVDIFPPGESHEDPEAKKKRTEIDKDRVKEHLAQWSSTALDAILGFFTNESLKYVCLFINKKDLLDNDMSDENIQAEFHELIELLSDKTTQINFNEKTTQVNFKVIVGSAERFDRVHELENDLRLYSISS